MGEDYTDDLEFNSLNSVSEPLVKVPKYNPNTSNFYNLSRRLQKTFFTEDALESRGSYRAVVLREEASSGRSSDLSSWFSLQVIQDLFQSETPALQILKVRIPELHAACPVPPQYGDEPTTTEPAEGEEPSESAETEAPSTASPSQGIINNFYPIVIAASTSTPRAKAGDVIYVDFGDRVNLTDGIYLGPVVDSTSAVGYGPASGGGSFANSGKITPGTGNAVGNALDEWKAWKGRHEKEWENDADLRTRLIKYWKAIAGNKDDQWIIDKYMIVGGGKDGPDDTKSQWSAAFITYTMRDDPSFKKLCRGGCGGHFNYVNGAMVNRFTNTSGWMTFLVSEWQAAGLAIQPGMLICSGHCDLVVDVNTMIGGNTLNTVGDGFRKGADTAGRMPAKTNAKRKWLMKKVVPGEKIPPLPADMEFQQMGFWNNKCGKGKNTCKTVRGYLNHKK